MINEGVRKLNQCICCNDIWNACNLNKITIGSHNLYFCPDCYKDFCDKYKEIENCEYDGDRIKGDTENE